MAGRTLIIPIYYIMLVACIGVSSNFSYRGFYETFPQEIAVVVLILALGLFGAGLMLQIGRDRQSISQQILAMIIFMIFASFSTSSNFNYIYTKMKWEDVRKEAFRQEYQKYIKTLEAIESELTSKNVDDQAYFERIASGYHNLIDEEITNVKNLILDSEIYREKQAFNKKLEFELDQMKIQATDQNAPGCGKKCRDHINTINSLIPSTETVFTSSRKEAEILDSWRNYKDIKMKVFCSEQFADFHRLRSFVEAVPSTDHCMSSNEQFREFYPGSELEKLRNSIKRASQYDEKMLLEYIAEVANVSVKIADIMDKLRNIGLNETRMTANSTEYPRTIGDAVEFLRKSNSDFDDIDISQIKSREKLISDLSRPDFYSDTVSSALFEESKTLIFDKNLSQNEVVQRLDEPLRPYLEVIAAKRQSIITRYITAMGLEEDNDFAEFKINTSNGQIGEVQNTVQYAWNHFSQTVVISFLLGIAFDIIPIIFAFAAFHGYKPKEKDYDPVIG